MSSISSKPVNKHVIAKDTRLALEAAKHIALYHRARAERFKVNQSMFTSKAERARYQKTIVAYKQQPKDTGPRLGEVVDFNIDEIEYKKCHSCKEHHPINTFGIRRICASCQTEETKQPIEGINMFNIHNHVDQSEEGFTIQ